MITIREVESNLRNIRANCIKAINESTGKVDPEIISAQAQALKKWIDDFVNFYVDEAKRKPIDTDKIGNEGRKIVDEAWNTYEMLLEVEQRAGEPLMSVKYEQLPSGIVKEETKTAMLSLLRDLYNHFSEYRRNILRT